MGSARKEGGSKHLRFHKCFLEKGKKMYRYVVFNEQFDERIGDIRWRGGWRQYVFQALPEIDMSRSCMKELISFIDSLMKEWRESLKVKK